MIPKSCRFIIVGHFRVSIIVCHRCSNGNQDAMMSYHPRHRAVSLAGYISCLYKFTTYLDTSQPQVSTQHFIQNVTIAVSNSFQSLNECERNYHPKGTELYYSLVWNLMRIEYNITYFFVTYYIEYFEQNKQAHQHFLLRLLLKLYIKLD